MKTKSLLWSMLVIMMVGVMSVGIASCTSSDDNDDPDNGQPVSPSTSVNDPMGTIALAMRNSDNGGTRLDNIYIDKENFRGAYFVSLGAVKGLGNVSTIPTTGWAEQVAVVAGNGYVAYSPSSNQYYRIYVVADIVGTTGGVIGADIKYQKPFKGVDESISLDENALTFTANGGSQSIVFNNKSLVIFDVTSDQSWCQVQKSSTYDNYFLHNAVTIYADAKASPGTDEATVTLTTIYNKKVEIKVSRLGAEPILELGEPEVNITGAEQNFNAGFITNYDLENLELANNNSWLSAEIVNGTRNMRAKAAAVRFIGDKEQPRSRAGSTSGDARSYYIQLAALANYDNQPRMGKIILRTKDNKASSTLTINQAGAKIQLMTESIEVSCDASTRNIAFSNLTMDLSELQINSNASWCTAELVDAKVRISVATNRTDTDRKAVITLSSTRGNATATIEVIQKKGEITFTNIEGVTIPNVGGTKNVGFASPYEMDELTVSSNASWCTPTISSDSQLTISAPENPTDKARTATVTLASKDGKVKNTLKVTQEASTMEAPEKIWLDRNQSTQTIELTTSLSSWTAKSNVSWCTLSQNGNKLTIRIEATTEDRTGTISFAGLSTAIQLIQSKYAVGDYYEEGNLKGEVLYMNGENRVIYQSLGNNYWSTEYVATGATDEHDGKKNMEVIKKIPNWQTLYPAFAKVEALNVNGETGWIFPAMYQLSDMGCRTFENYTWSSTENSVDFAYNLNRIREFKHYNNGIGKNHTIAIHMF